MTGTGTQNDPFIISTAAELYSMSTAGGADKYFRLGADIDFNGTLYADDFTPIPLNCAQLDGAGHTIRNVYKYLASGDIALFTVGTAAVTLKDLKLANIYLSGTMPYLFMASSSASVTLTHCSFGLDIGTTSTASNSSGDTRCIMHSANVSLSASLCTFTVRARMEKCQPFMCGGSLTGCILRLEVIYSVTRSTSDGPYSAFLYNVTAVDCGFLGTAAFTSSGYSLFYIAYAGSETNCYCTVNFTGVSTVYWSCSFRSVCPWRSGNTSGNLEVDPSTGYRVKWTSTPDMKNAAALRAIGFSCEG